MPKFCSDCGDAIVSGNPIAEGNAWLCADCAGAVLADFDIEEDEIDDDFYFPSPYEIAEDDCYEF